jgi:hypothetical protein
MVPEQKHKETENMAFTDKQKEIFDHVSRVAKGGRLALIETTRKSDGSPVTLVAAVFDAPDGSGRFALMPFGEFFGDSLFDAEHGPYTKFNSPEDKAQIYADEDLLARFSERRNGGSSTEAANDSDATAAP